MSGLFGLAEPVTLPRILAATAARHGEREAIVTDGARLTYAELADRAAAAAAAMRRSGIGRGDHVGLLLGNSVDWVVLFYAAASIGAVTVPLHTRFRADELRYCLAQGDIGVLFYAGRFLKIDFTTVLADIEPALATGLPGAALPRWRRAIVLDGAVPAGAVAHAEWLAGGGLADAEPSDPGDVAPDDLLLVQYTSGTTSFPKGVMLTHRSMLQNAAAAAACIGVRPDDRYYSVRPFAHVGGSTLTLLVALVSGATVVTQPAYDVGRALALMRDERCTLVSGNDTIFQMLMAHDQFDRHALSLRGGWAAAGPEVMRRILDELGAATVNAYGLSEASPNIGMSRWTDTPEDRVHGWVHPHAGTEVRIVDAASGRMCAAGEPGEIRVRGWNVMRGYYGKPDETARVLDADGWLATGDLGEMDAGGRLRMIGRIKDVIRVGGENVSPAEVEDVIHRHPDVEMAQVVGVPDRRLVEVPAAYVQPRAGATLQAGDVVAWCAARCASFKVPRYVRIVESFNWAETTGSAKIRKDALARRAVIDFGLVPAPTEPTPTRADA